MAMNDTRFISKRGYVRRSHERDIAVFECTLYELKLSLDFGVPQRLTQCLKDQPRIVIEEEP